MSAKIKFNGTITAVKARIRLLRSFDQVHHAYLGYTLVMDAVVDGKDWKGCRIAVGQKTHEKHIFLKGDHISGEAVPIEHSEQERADFYKVSGLKLISRGDASENHPADMNGGIASPLSVYRENGHLRLDPKTYESKCSLCSWGLVMATEIILDHWNPSRKNGGLRLTAMGRETAQIIVPVNREQFREENPEWYGLMMILNGHSPEIIEMAISNKVYAVSDMPALLQ